MSETPSVPAPPSGPAPSRTNRTLIVVIVVIAVIAIVLGVLAAVALLKPGSSPSPIGSPTATPTASPTATPTAAPTATPTPSPTTGTGTGNGAAAPQIQSFQVTPTTVTCSTGGPAFPGVTSAPLTIAWTATGATQVFLGVDTDDASAAPYSTGLPLSGTETSIQYSCYESHRYTLTIVGANGVKVSRTVTVTNVGDKP